jgi:hypothetical protein
VEIVQIVLRQGLEVIFHVDRFSLQEPAVCRLVADLLVYTQTSFQSLMMMMMVVAVLKINIDVNNNNNNNENY